MNDDPLRTPRFPRASTYHPGWVRGSVSGGANSLWLTEWLGEAFQLAPGMRVLDLGCGRGASSVFLHREFDVQVWSVDLWCDVDERARRIRDAGCDHAVFPIRADARALPFARDFFDAVVSVDSYVYYGTDDLYLGYLARLVRPGGQIGIVGAGVLQEVDEPPDHLSEWWEPSLACLHSPAWWRRHWSRSGLVDVELSDALPDGWLLWQQWQRAVAPDIHPELRALAADRGRYLGYVRTVARRREMSVDDPLTSVPVTYDPPPLLASPRGPRASLRPEGRP